jgi:predicted dehydrogenase
MVRIGIVGCGYWGSKHLRVFNALPGCNVQAICDANPELLEQMAGAYEPELATTNFEELLSGPVDAVVIATPARTHFRLTQTALQADKHVLVEKPFTATSSEALELVHLADERELTLMVGHTFVYNPAIIFLKDLLQRGHLGDLYHVHMARLNFGLLQPDVDVVWDLAPHDLSIILYLLDQEPIAVGARGSAHINPSLKEVAHMDLQFSQGETAHIHLSWLDPCKVRRLTLVGSERMAICDDLSPGEMIRIYDKRVKLTTSNGSPVYHPVEYAFGDTSIPYIADQEPLRNEGTHFLHCIRSGEHPRSDGRAGLQVVRILETVEKSLYNGGAMEPLAPAPEVLSVDRRPGVVAKGESAA